ncbi:MAG: hypothetical protein VST68_12640 [Nitrospirota bacterium]|nr:hypothetical protein [Nitrospirota bacterium]
MIPNLVRLLYGSVVIDTSEYLGTIERKWNRIAFSDGQGDMEMEGKKGQHLFGSRVVRLEEQWQGSILQYKKQLQDRERFLTHIGEGKLLVGSYTWIVV